MYKIWLSITGYASISTHNAVYIIGGWDYGYVDKWMVPYRQTSIIAKYQNGWEHVNDLMTARGNADAIQYNGKIMVIGGRNRDLGFEVS